MAIFILQDCQATMHCTIQINRLFIKKKKRKTLLMLCCVFIHISLFFFIHTSLSFENCIVFNHSTVVRNFTTILSVYMNIDLLLSSFSISIFKKYDQVKQIQSKFTGFISTIVTMWLTFLSYSRLMALACTIFAISI